LQYLLNNIGKGGGDGNSGTNEGTQTVAADMETRQLHVYMFSSGTIKEKIIKYNNNNNNNNNKSKSV
jgi:hypothetical protein